MGLRQRSLRSRTTERRRHAGALSIIVALIALALGASGVQALTLLPADVADMVGGSQLIVHGQVVDVRSATTASRRTIETVITLAVADVLKGSANREVVFRVPGGQVGRYRRILVGAPQFATGQEVVVFLSGRAPAIPMPFGLSQGVYRVVRAGDGRAMVIPLLTSSTVAGPVVRGDSSRRPLALEEFARQVRDVAAGRR
jgi:hypothetical protein